MSETQSLLPGITEEETVAKEQGDRQRNTLATPEFLASIVTCCQCKGPIDSGRRYLCVACSQER